MKKTTITAAITIVSISGLSLFSTRVLAAETNKDILFTNSFEDKEVADFKESTKSEKGAQNLQGDITKKLVGNVTRFVDTSKVSGSSDYNSNETKAKVFDDNVSTKWLTKDELPVNISFELTETKVITSYSITSANDASGRDPKTWEFLGSNDNEEWTSLDKQSNQTWSARLQEKSYSFENKTGYKYYKLIITANNGESMTQFSELAVATGNATDDDSSSTGNTEFMKSELSTGPGTSINQKTNVGWTGKKALKISGEQTADGKGYSYNDIFDVNIPIAKNTHLSYVVFPDQTGEYDYSYMSMHVAVDLKFTDGSYLSDLKAIDDNGNVLSPSGQGESRTLTYQQWNKISSNIGQYAEGKTIDKIVVGYQDDSQEASKSFAAYFDDIEISNYDDEVYDRKSDYVNILRGTNDSPSFSRGLTAPAVATPHGFNFWAPVTNSNSNKLYDYQQNGGTKFQHMTVSHEPSYWVGDRGTWQFMVNTSLKADSVTSADQISASKIASEFSHDDEEAKAHYYKVAFASGSPASGSTLETTPSEHGAISRFTFDKTAENHNVIFDSVRANGEITIDEKTNSFSGYTDHTSNGMTRMYVYGTFNKDIASSKVLSNKQAIVNFASDVNEVEMQVATSFISVDQAKKSIALEIGDKDFDALKESTQKTWDKQLDTIEVEGATKNQLVTLYSNMYRLLAYPNNYSENTGTNEKPVWKYSSPYSSEVTNGKIYSNNGFWDTYRTTWSAYSLLTPTKYNEMLDGLVQHYNDNTWVPRWIAPGGTNSMVGTSSDIIFADAVMKSASFDQEGAFKSSIKNAAVVSQNLTGGGRNKLNVSNFIGYVPYNLDSHGFSWSMEGYINDYGISQMATKLGYTDEAAYYKNRALNYQLLFDKKSTATDSWFKGKTSTGDWSWTDASFDPKSWAHDYTETDAYNMSVSVPFDGQGLVNLYGSKEALASKIDSIINNDGEWTGGNIHEMLEAREIKLGQYGHSNQPSHHILYMYNYAGQAYKTQQYVRDVLKRVYVGSDFGQGYIGDEDNGEMSAWYIFSSLGFYPLSVGSNEYAIGSPLFTKATVNLENGKQLVINAPNNSDDNIYVQSVKLNGEEHTKSVFTHDEISKGATIDFDMGSEPNKEWGSSDEDLPTSLTTDETEALKQDMMSADVDVTTKDTSGFKDLMITDVKDAANLVDNTSDNTVTIDNQSVTYKFAKDQKVSIYTISSAKDSAGQSFDKVTLSGSTDGKTWTTIDTRKKVEFEWSQYTRPFLVDESKQANYSYYKLDFEGTGKVSELELLGVKNTEATKEDLDKAIAVAEKVDQTDFDADFKQSFNDVINEAKAISDNSESKSADYQKGIDAIDRIIKAIDSQRDAYSKVEAETFDSGNVVNDGKNIGGVKVGYFASYSGVNFKHQSANYFEINYAGQGSDTCADATVEVHLDSLDNDPVFTIATPPTADSGWSTYKTVSTELTDEQSAQLNGVHDVYLKFVGTGKTYVCNVDWFRFATKVNVATTATNGTVSNSGKVVKEYGESIDFTLEPNDGYVPSKVEINGVTTELDSSKTTYTIDSVKEDLTVNFIFDKKAEEDVPVTGIKVDTTAITTLKKGKELKLSVSIEPENATNKTITWEVAKSDIASVDENGVVKGLKAGITNVTALSSNGKKSSFTLRVTQ